MSDSQKQQRPGATIKNPLLSASVTGLTFDDFPNKPLLLPAAPPIAHTHSPAAVVTASGLTGREPKSLVTVGSSSLDTENLDEINLNASNEYNQASDVADPNANPLLEQSSQGTNSDSILSQAASSFSALPSVASNVFSTFSKRINAISSRETTPVYDQYQQDSNSNTLTSQLDIQQFQQADVHQAPASFYATPLGGNPISSSFDASSQDTQKNLTSLEPPKFYTPSDVPPLPTISATPSNSGGQNNFRFSSKKKLYAPIPGLSDQSQRPTTALGPPNASAPICYDTSYISPTSDQHYTQTPFSTPGAPKPDERKLGSGLFSKITNLAPTGVLQNLSGLVQTAAGSLTQTNKSDFYEEAPPVAFDQQNKYFEAAPPPPPTNYFIPQDLPNTQNIQSPSFFGGQQSETSQFFIPQPVSQGVTESSFQPQPFVNSCSTATQITPCPIVQSTPQPTYSNSESSNLILSSTHFQTAQANPTESALSTATQVPFFDPTKYLPPNGQTSVIGQSNPLATSLPPVTTHKIPPPTSGQTSYRLQKGTKLYKNPLTPQETAPIQVKPNQIQQTFGLPESVPLFTSPTVGDQKYIQSLPTSEPPSAPSQSGVPLFAPPPSFSLDSLSNRTAQAVPLFAPATTEHKSIEVAQTAPLFAPYNNATQRLENQEKKVEKQPTASFAPPLKKLKSNDSAEKVYKLDTTTDNKVLDELKPNEPEQCANILEPLRNKDLTNIPAPDNKSDFTDNNDTEPTFEPIEPVFEPNITALKEEASVDPLEETLQKLSLAVPTSETTSVKLPPITESFNLKNPYRKDSSAETANPAPILPTLANFFAAEPSAGQPNLSFPTVLPSTQSSGSKVNFFSEPLQDKEVNKENSDPIKSNQSEPTNFFCKPFSSELTPIQPQTAVHPPISAFFPTTSVPAISEDKQAISDHLKDTFIQDNLPPPKGFENLKQLEKVESTLPDKTPVRQSDTIQKETTIQAQQPEIVNRFSNYFNQTYQQPEIVKDPLTFFDSFSGQQQQAELTAPSGAITNEEQRIQYFFNNPPPKDASHVGDLNYDLVHIGLGIKNLQQRSLTPISNLVEPPSSACSEFSEISNSTAAQKSIAANLSIAESSDKSFVNQESNKSTIEESNSGIIESNVQHYAELPKEVLEELRMANLLSADKTSTSPVASVSYKPAVKHWFFKSTINDKQIWVPFSHYDSALLETSLLMEGDEKSNIVAVEGGRYDVNINERKKMSVYWESQPIEVRRCSWFYKAVDSKYVPYEEQTAEMLENEYKQAAESGVWHKTIILGMGEQVMFHGPTVIVHFQQQQNADAWGGTTQTATRPRVVKRDLDDFVIEQGESQKVDHLLFMVHGIGSACDLKLRSVEEVVEDFRTIARQLVQSHYKNSTDLGLVGRVEVLPISWHSHLHSAEMGIDEKLRMITLESIPKLRNFTNDTLLDILFYTSPTFCQKIMNTIVSSMNTLYLKYRERHPEFNGGVSLAGHSLGSLILFDLLCHQNPIKESEEKNLENPDQFVTEMDSNQLEDKQISYTMGPAGTGQPFIHYNQLIFQPKKFFALGSPIGMFVTIRGIDKLGLDFRLPTCPGFYNIFHPYDPVAYRIEALVNPDLSGIRPVLIPHHKGRKRMHLELKETMARVSMDLKNRFLDKFKTTLDSVNIFGSSTKSTKEAEEMMEKEVDKVIQMQMQLEQQNDNRNITDNLPSGSDGQNESAVTPRQRTDSVSTAMSDDVVEIDFPLGKLNDSKRIDYVLQEAPLEFINEYIFALSSHVCYWDSEDTILFVMKEIYSGLGISPDSQVPQQTMTIERPSSRNSLISS